MSAGVAEVVKTFGKPQKTDSLDDFRYALSIAMKCGGFLI